VHSIAKPILIAAGIILSLYAASLLCLNIYLQSEGVQSKIRSAVFQATGLEPVISRTYYAPWSGLTLSGIHIPQGGNAKKPLLALRSVKFHIALTSLLQGRLVISSTTLEEPALVLLQGESGVWPDDSLFPFQKIDKKNNTLPAPIAQAESPTLPEEALQASPRSETQPAGTPDIAENQKNAAPLILENIEVQNAKATFYSKQGGGPIRLEGIHAEGHLSLDGTAWGVFRIKSASLAESVRPSNITGNFEYSGGMLKITGVHADWAGGRMTGFFELADLPGAFFTGAVEVENVSLQKLAEEAGFSADGTKGLLFAKANLQGTPGLPESFTGGASAHLSEARMQPIDPLRQLGELLRINELRVLELRNAETLLNVRDGKILVERLQFESANLLMDATGHAGFDGSLNLDARFHIGNNLLKNSLGFMGSKFKPSEQDGYAHMPFSITGTMARPKTDLLDKLVGMRIGDDVGGLLKNLLRIPKKEKRKKENKPEAAASPTN